jgi:hypothetical protein
MADRYLYVGDHADTLSSGRPVAPGDRIPASALDSDGADQRFLDDELLIDDREAREQAKADAKEDK